MDDLPLHDKAKIRRIVALAPGSEVEGGELNVVPFLDIVVNVVLFVIATMPVVFTATIATTPPSIGPGTRAPHDKTLGVSVLVVEGGIDVKTNAANVGPGCEGIGAGLTLPNDSSGYRFRELRACLERIKTEYDGEPDASITVMADPAIAYQTIIEAVDAVRTTEAGEPLFADVQFGVPR